MKTHWVAFLAMILCSGPGMGCSDSNAFQAGPGGPVESGFDAGLDAVGSTDGAPGMDTAPSFDAGPGADAAADNDAAPAAKPPQVQTSSLPVAGLNEPYEAVIQASGDESAIYNWSVTSGALPSGMNLQGGTSLQASLTGTPKTAGPFAFTVRIDDGHGLFDEQALQLEVHKPQWLVYRADEDQPGVYELYAVDLLKQGPLSRIKLNAPMPDGADVAHGSAASSSDGAYLAYVVLQGTQETVHVVDMSGASPGEPIDFVFVGKFWSWASASHQFLVKAPDHSLHLVDASATPPSMTLIAPPGIDWTVTWAPNGKRLMYYKDTCSSMTVVDVSDPVVQHHVVPDSKVQCTIAYFARDNRHIYLKNDWDELFVADGDYVMPEVKLLAANDIRTSVMGNYPDVFFSGFNDLYYKNAALNEPIVSLETHNAATNFIESPEGGTILFASNYQVNDGPQWKSLDTATQLISNLNVKSDIELRPVIVDENHIGMKFEDTDGTHILQLYKRSGTKWSPSWQLNLPAVVGSRIDWEVFAPDMSGLVYRADEQTLGTPELFYVDMRDLQPRPPVRINHAFAAGEQLALGYFVHDSWSLDAKRFLYVTSDANGGRSLYVVDLSQQVPSAPVRINGTGRYTLHEWVP